MDIVETTNIQPMKDGDFELNDQLTKNLMRFE